MKSLLILLALCSGATAFVYTCNEVKEHIAKQTVFSATYACVSLDDYISLNVGFAKEIFVEDTAGVNKWSLADLSKGCVNSTVPSWRVTTNRPDNAQDIDCDYEFTLMFSSVPTTIVTTGDDAETFSVSEAGYVTIVSSWGGILVDFSCSDVNGNLAFYSGIGNGEKEEMFLMGNTLCDKQLSVWALDTAITVKIPDSEYVSMMYWGTGGYLSIGAFAYDMVVMGSGRANNLVQHGDDDKFLWLDSDYGVTFTIDDTYEMDEKVGNNIVLTAVCHPSKAHCSSQVIPLNDSSIHLSVDADLLSLDYYTKVNQSTSYRNDDLFFFKIISTALPVSPTPPPLYNTDYSCGCALIDGKADFAPSIWMDIVFVVDVSQSMTSSNLQETSTYIDTIVASLTLDSNGSKQYSRIGLIAASDKAQVIADLSAPYSSPTKLTGSSAFKADIGAAVSAATSMFANSTARSARQMIYIIAASDSSTTSFKINFSKSKILTTSAADPFKEAGGIIAVTEMLNTPSTSLSTYASPGYYNKGFSQDVNLDLKMLCDANCFCHSLFSGYTDAADERSTPNRGCFMADPAKFIYSAALSTCKQYDAGISVIHDSDKQFFLNSLIAAFGNKQSYWIGYEFDDGKWRWIDDSNSTYSSWMNGQPDASVGECSYSVQTTGLNSGWYNDKCNGNHMFICERDPCSVKSYCH